MLQSAMPVMCRVLVPEVLPAVMPDVPAVPEVLPVPPPDLVLPARLPAGLPAEGRAALAAALAGTVPGGRQRDRGDLVRTAGPACWDEGECARLLRFLGAVGDPRGLRGRVYPLDYMLALPLVAGMAGDDELDAAGEWIASAPEELLLKLGAPRDRAGRARRPDATALGRVLAAVDQCQYDDALCAWAAARARTQRPGLRKHLRVDGKALRGAAPRGGRAPMLLSGIWDDGTTAAQRPVDVKTNEIPVFRQLLKKIPDQDLAGAVVTADQMHTQREHARQIAARDAYFVFTIGENQPGLFDAADALCWKSVAVEAWTADRGHGRVDVRTIKTMPATARIAALFPHASAGLPRRALQLRPGREPARRGRRPRHHQPAAGPGRPRRPAGVPARPLGHRNAPLRDVIWKEDKSLIRTGNAPQVWSALANLVITLFRIHGVTSYTEETRRCAQDPRRTLRLLDLTGFSPG